jgi:glycosyltransferase involved in cell wall biosynthesis
MPYSYGPSGMKKSLLYIANVRMPTEKGHAVQIMNMCASFAELGWEVTLLVPHRKTPITADPFEFYNVPPSFKIARIFALDIAWRGPISYWLDTLAFSLGAAWYALWRNPAFIYSRDSFPLAIVSFLRPWGLVFEVHTGRRGYSLSRVFRIAKIVTITRGLRDLYVERFGIDARKILVEPTGVDLRRFDETPDKSALRRERGIPVDAFVVGFAGKLTTMGEGKGVEDLLRAFAQFREREARAHLLIVGANRDEVPGLERAASLYGVPPRALQLVEHVENARVATYLQAADILVMNYPDLEHYAHYMSPFKLFEYMASGVPFVTTDLPSVREVVDENLTTFVAPGDTHALAETLVTVARDREVAHLRALRARLAVAQYTWPKRAERIAAFVTS